MREKERSQEQRQGLWPDQLEGCWPSVRMGKTVRRRFRGEVGNSALASALDTQVEMSGWQLYVSGVPGKVSAGDKYLGVIYCRY